MKLRSSMLISSLASTAMQFAFAQSATMTIPKTVEAGQGFTVASVGSGVVAGIVLTLALSKVMSHWATDSASSFNPLVIIGATLILAAVAALACALPARRAAEVDPMKAIRYE